jgi:NADPH:quinone reductase-like Zn-dependent oxidoreductase
MQLARWAGARVLVTAGTEAKRRRALLEDVEAAIDYTLPGWSEQVLAATGGRGVDLAIDHTGSEHFAEVIRCLAPRGRVVICGASGGSLVGLDLIDLFARQISVIGSSDGSRAELLQVLELLARGVLRPAIDTRLPLRDAPEAQRRLVAREHDGRILLIPGTARPTECR